MDGIPLQVVKDISSPYPLSVTAMHCVLCGRPSRSTVHVMTAQAVWNQVQAEHPDIQAFALTLCEEHRNKNNHEEIVAILKTRELPRTVAGLDSMGIPQTTVPFGALALGARFYRLSRQGTPIEDTLYVRADTVQRVSSTGPDMIHNAISLHKIDAYGRSQPSNYLFDDWMLVMPAD